LETTRCLTFRGDSITAMALDARNGKVLAAMTDRKMRVFDLARMEGRKDKHGNWIDDGVKGDETKGEEGEDASEGTEKPTETEEGEETPKEEKEEKVLHPTSRGTAGAEGSPTSPAYTSTTTPRLTTSSAGTAT
jgi:hypothetical protein